MRVGWQNLSLVEWMDPAGISALKCPMWCGLPKWERFNILSSLETFGYTVPWMNSTTFNFLPGYVLDDFKSHLNSTKAQNDSDSLLVCPVCALSQLFKGPAAWKHTAKRWHSMLIRGSQRNYRTVTNCVPRIPILLHNGVRRFPICASGSISRTHHWAPAGLAVLTEHPNPWAFDMSEQPGGDLTLGSALSRCR